MKNLAIFIIFGNAFRCVLAGTIESGTNTAGCLLDEIAVTWYVTPGTNEHVRDIYISHDIIAYPYMENPKVACTVQGRPCNTSTSHLKQKITYKTNLLRNHTNFLLRSRFESFGNIQQVVKATNYSIDAKKCNSTEDKKKHGKDDKEICQCQARVSEVKSVKPVFEVTHGSTVNMEWNITLSKNQVITGFSLVVLPDVGNPVVSGNVNSQMVQEKGRELFGNRLFATYNKTAGLYTATLRNIQDNETYAFRLMTTFSLPDQLEGNIIEIRNITAPPKPIPKPKDKKKRSIGEIVAYAVGIPIGFIIVLAILIYIRHRCNSDNYDRF